MNFFPFGTQYYREPTPLPSEWAKDLKNISKAGYTHIQLRPQWKWHEKEQGNYTFDDIDALMDLAHKNNLKVIIKPMLECAPDWIFRNYEGHRVGFNGIPMPPFSHGAFYVGGWLPCFDNPHVEKYAFEYSKTIAERYNDHPALWFYNAWNEPRSRPAGQCQCEHSKESYRNWLRNKFGTIENMNAIYGKAYTSFELIDPPASANDYVEMLLWRDWATYAVSQHVKIVYDGIKSVDSSKKVMCHVGCCQMINDSLFDSTDDVLNASVVDFYGTSFPVALHPKNLLDMNGANLVGDWLRCVDENFWVQEFYPNEGEWGRPPKKEELRRILWSALSTGTNGFTFWQYRSERLGNETNGWGMREINGNATERSQVCDEIAQKLVKYGSILKDTKRRKPKIAQIFHKDSDVLSRLQSCKEAFMIDEKPGGDNFYKRALAANHFLFGTSLVGGIDFVTWEKDFTDYKAITLASNEIITETMANKLRDYVKAGGNLIIEFPFACRDENTWVSLERPNNKLEDLLGFKEKSRITSDDEVAEFEQLSQITNLPWYIECEPKKDAIIFGKWNTGAPCAVKNKYGKGCVYSLIASPSLVYKGEYSAPANSISKYILSDIGFEHVLPTGLSIKIRENEKHSIMFIFNYSNEDIELNFTMQNREAWDMHNTEIIGDIVKIKHKGYVIICETK